MFSIPTAGKSGAGITIEWKKAAACTSPVTGDTYVSEKWTTYEPQSSSPAAKQRVAVNASRIVLLTSGRDLQARTTAEDLGTYVNAIGDVVDAFFTPPSRRAKHELTIHLALLAEANEVRIVAVPNLSVDDEQDPQKRLLSVSPPKVGGSVKLDYILNVGGVLLP